MIKLFLFDNIYKLFTLYIQYYVQINATIIIIEWTSNHSNFKVALISVMQHTLQT